MPDLSYQPRLKTKTGAVLLALFLGDLGAHWFYLGERNRGMTYLFGWPVILVLLYLLGLQEMMPGQETSPAVMIATLPLGLGALALIVSRIWDFFWLLSMHPTDFDRRYNL